MLLTRWRLLLLLPGLGGSLLRAASPAQAQVPAGLPGQWELHQISFTTNQAVPPEMLARMDNPEVAELNRDVASGAAHLRVEFRPDGTYQFSIARAGQPTHTETGTYSVQKQTLYAQSPDATTGSSFNSQKILQLSRRKLVVSFLVGEELPGISEEVEYRRVQ